MLIQFRVANHRSLRDEQVLSMVAADLTGGTVEVLRSSGIKESLLPAVALYGANASGKSNVLQALFFARHAVLLSHRRWEPNAGAPVEPFAFSAKADEPSTYEFDLILDEVRHRYGFILDASGVVQEWLQAWPRGRQQTWFERNRDGFEFGKHLRGENETIRSLTRSNSLFLSAAAQNNHPQLLAVFNWFRRLKIHPSGRLVHRRTLDVLNHPRERNQLSLFEFDDDLAQSYEAILRLLRAADVGIVDLKLAKREDDRFGRVDVMVRHKTADEARAWLRLDAESAGTITLFNLALPLLETLRSGGLMLIDELEASLHPSLALEILRLFNDRAHNPGRGQILFTTHDTNLLGRELADEPPLRRDQIWFTEKDEDGATELYPLTDFHPRKTENLERGYLQGRYGAIPYLGNFPAQVIASGSADDPVS